MSKQVTAKAGDTLCGIAISAGFLNCARLRTEPANSAFLSGTLNPGDLVTVPDLVPKDLPEPTEKRHKFTKKNAPPVSVRFVHGSPDKKYLEDLTLSLLNVSNFQTNKGGALGDHAFPKGFGFNADGHADVDTFKVEVVDPGASGTVTVLLEALKPVKQPDGSIQFQPLTGVTNANLRKIDSLECKQVSTGHVAFRSRYMRLVVDQPDQAAADGQTLLTTDAVDDGDEALEILDQHVRASFEFSRCPGTPKCKTTAELPIGENKLRAKVSVHILEDPATGTPVCTVDEARKSMLKFVRQLYAQVSMSIKIGTVRSVPAPTNLISIANANGALALGGNIQIRVQIGQPKQATFDFDQNVQITTNPTDNPLATATALANAINAAFAAATPPFSATATASGNPALTGQTIGSADVVVGDPLTQNISLSILASGDTAHPVTIGRVLSTEINPAFGNNDSHVGTLPERTLVKNYDTGSDHIDLFVVDLMTEQDGGNDLGEAFIPNASRAASLRPNSLMVNSAVVVSGAITSDKIYRTAPHEMAHILTDKTHEVVVNEMMVASRPVKATDRAINGPKRISDRIVGYDDLTRSNPVTAIRTANSGLIDPF